MLRVKDEEFSLRERRDNSYHRRRRYSDDYDSEADLYQQYKAAGLDDNMVHRTTDMIVLHINLPFSTKALIRICVSICE